MKSSNNNDNNNGTSIISLDAKDLASKSASPSMMVQQRFSKSAYAQLDYYSNQDGNYRRKRQVAEADTQKLFYWLGTLPGAILILCIVFGLASSFYNVYTKGLPPTWFYTMADPESKALYFGNHLSKLWPHIAVFALGILAGLECRRAARNMATRAKGSSVSSRLSSRDQRNHQQYYHDMRHQDNAVSSKHTNSSNNILNSDNQLKGHQNHLLSASLPVIPMDSCLESSISSSSISSVTFDQQSDAPASQDPNPSDTKENKHHHVTSPDNTSNHQRNTGNSICINLNSSLDNIYNHHSSGNSMSDLGGLHDNDDENINLHSKIGRSSREMSENSNDSSSTWASIILHLLGCLFAITTMSMIIFSTHDWSLNHLPEPLVSGLFDAGSRLLWSLALIWILYMVSVPGEDRKFGLMAQLLGHPLMVSLGKLSFLVYIIHPLVHTTVLAIQEQPIYSSWLMMFHILIGNISITVILASLVSIFVEMPCRNLFRRCGASLLVSTNTQTRNGNHEGQQNRKQ